MTKACQKNNRKKSLKNPTINILLLFTFKSKRDIISAIMFSDLNNDIRLLRYCNQNWLDVVYNDDKSNFHLIQVDCLTWLLERIRNFFTHSSRYLRLQEYARNTQEVFQNQICQFDSEQVEAFYAEGLSKWDFTLFNRADLSNNILDILRRNLGTPFRGDATCSYSEEQDIEKARQEAELALKLGVAPKKNKGCQGSIIYLDYRRKPIGIFKQEKLSNGFYARAKRLFQTLGGVLSNQTVLSHHEKTHAEVAASVADKSFSVGLIPLTRMVTIDGKKGSFQLWSTGVMEAAQFNPEKDPDEEELYLFQKMVMYDFLLGNLDRHLENWLLGLNRMKKIDRIVMIDNGSILPEEHPTENLRDFFTRKHMYEWKKHPWAHLPFSDRINERMRNLTPERIEEYIEDIKRALPDEYREFLNEKRLSNLALRASLLRTAGDAADPHFSPQELGEAFTTSKLEQLKAGIKKGDPLDKRTAKRRVRMALERNPHYTHTLIDHLTNAGPHLAPREVTDMLLHENARSHLPEILRGANVQIENGQALFRELSAHRSARLRTCSHERVGEAYGIDTPLFGEVLFWMDKNQHLRVQLEANSTRKPKQAIAHLGDYFRYKATGKQQGPYGSSWHTDRRPIQISLTN